MKLTEYILRLYESSDIEDWLKTAKASLAKQNYVLDWKKGPKYWQVWTEQGSSSGRSAYCFVDMEGNLYKAAGWGKVAKGIRGTVNTVDATKIDPYTSWLYKR